MEIPMPFVPQQETQLRDRFSLIRTNLFLVCTLTWLFTSALFPWAAYAQNTEFPIYPKYQVMGVVYAPPGAASSVTYGNSTLVGSSHSMVTNSTSDNVTSSSQTTGFSLFGFGDSTTTTTSDSWGTAATVSNTYAMQTTAGNSVTTMGPVSSSLGVNHDNDIIYIWLNPVVISTVTNTTFPYTLNWSGMQFNSCDLTDASDQVNFLQLMNGCDPNQYPYPDIIGIPVWCLKNPYYPGQACAQWQPFTSRSWDVTPWGTDANGVPLGPGLTLQDYADILRSDPFISQTIAPDTYTVDYYCHPTYGVNLDPNDTEVIPDSTKFSTAVLHTGSAWPASFCGSTGKTMSRFDPYGTVQYPAPGPNGEPQTYTGSFTYNTTSTTGVTATTTQSHSYNQNTTYSFAFGASFAPLLNTAGAVFAANLSAGFNFSFSNGSGYSYSSAQTNTTADSKGTTNSAGYSITGPQSSDNYNGPVTFNVYKDNVYGTFAFYSDEQRLQPPIQLSVVSGQAPIGVSTTTSFGTVQVGSSSTAQTITLTNNSPYPMTLVGPAVTFTDPGFQIVAGSDFCSDAQLQPYGTAPYTCTMTIQFSPVLSDAPNTIAASYPIHAYLTAAGTENVSSWENFLVTSTGAVVSATATPAATTCTNIKPYCNTGATLSPVTYTFASEVWGSTTTQTEVFTFKNYYSSALTISGITSSDIVDYSITSDNCTGKSVSNLGTCTFTLTYLPKASGTLNTKVTVLATLNGVGTPVTYSGATGVVNTLSIGASGASLSLETTCPSCPGGTSSQMTIYNTSSYTLTNVNVSVATVSGPSGWSGSGCSGSIAPGGSCLGTISFYYSSGCSSNCTATGTATVTGTENGTGVSTTAGVSCSITFEFGGIKINGAEASKTVTTPATPGKAAITLNGSVKTAFTGTRHVVVTVGGFKASAAYTANFTSAEVAAALGAAANASGSPVTATVSGSQVAFTSKVTGIAGNLAYSTVGTADFTASPSSGSLTGGAPAVTTTGYDGGSVDATVGSVAATANWGKGSTAQSIAGALAASLNAASKGAFTASASGGTVTIVPAQNSTLPGVTATVSDKMGFNPASFSATTN
jgi:hypothetical protein